MVEIVGLVPFVIISLTFMFFELMNYAREQLKRDEFNNKISDGVFFTALYYLALHLCVLTIPIAINLTWLCLDSIGDVELDGLIIIFETLTIFGWMFYTFFIGLFLIYIIIILLERIGIISNKEKKIW